MNRHRMVLCLAVLLACVSMPLCAQLPVPREQAVVIETDTAYTNLGVANPLFPAGNGYQWGSPRCWSSPTGT